LERFPGDPTQPVLSASLSITTVRYLPANATSTEEADGVEQVDMGRHVVFVPFPPGLSEFPARRMVLSSAQSDLGVELQ
jgi:hypothetical protein